MGIFGSLLVLADNDVANVMFAMVLGFLVRMRLDFYNHALAATMVILAFAFKAHVVPDTFLFFFASFVLFGFLRDYVGDVRKKKDVWYRINEPAWYYVLPPILYGLMTGNWLLSLVSIAYIVGYDLVKLRFNGF